MPGQGKLECSRRQRIVFTSFFFFALFHPWTTWVHTVVHPSLHTPFSTRTNQNSLPTDTLTSILVVGWWDKAVCVAQRIPLCVCHSWVSTWNLSLFSKTIITCHAVFSALISLPLSPPFPSLPSSQLVDVINSGQWNVILEFCSFWVLLITHWFLEIHF